MIRLIDQDVYDKNIYEIENGETSVLYSNPE